MESEVVEKPIEELVSKDDDNKKPEKEAEVNEPAEESGKIVENTENKEVDYDDEEEESGDEYEVITKETEETATSNKNIYSIKNVNNLPSQNAYKLSRTGIDLNNPGNIHGVPTIEYDLSKLVDEYKPWKKPGADITDYFNYGFTEETWLIYCEKQKNLRLSHENSTLKTLNGFNQFGYPLSGSHIHLGINRAQTMDKMRNDGNQGNKISTIPVQTGLHVGPNQNNNLMPNLGGTGQNTPLDLNVAANSLLAAIGMGMLPQAPLFNPATGLPGNGPPLPHVHQGAPSGFWMDPQQQGGGMPQGQMGGFDNGGIRRSNSNDSMHSNEEYEDHRNFSRSDRSNRRERDDYGSSRRRRSRDKRDKSPERRRRSRSRERDRDYESSRYSKRRNRSPLAMSNADTGSRRSRSRENDDDSSRRHRYHRHRRSDKRDKDEGSSSKRRSTKHKTSSRHKRSRSKESGSQQTRTESQQYESSPVPMSHQEHGLLNMDEPLMKIKKEMADD